MAQIPFNRPFATGREFGYIQQALEGMHISGDGNFTRACQDKLSTLLGSRAVLLTTSCTHALEMAALLLRLQPGDEVALPAFTFVSTANAFALHGARPVFVDVRPDTLNLDETALATRITGRTRAVVPVHYGGVGCEMDAIRDLAQARGLTVIEDNAHGLFGRYRGRNLGTLGELATLSFHETKNLTCGEGGALVINDASYCERAEILREKGTNRNRFFRGQVDKYTWVDLGSSYVPSDILAAYLFAQLEVHEDIQARRRRIWESYALGLQDWCDKHEVRAPIIPPHCDSSYHLYYLLLPRPEQRDALIAHLRSRDIMSVFHYQPLHLSAMGRRFGGQPGDCPVTEYVAGRLVRLPFYNDLSQADQERVIGAVLEFAW